MAEFIAVIAPVERVELFEDRAAVTRWVPLPQSPGRHLLVIEATSPLIAERGLVFPGSEAVVVEEARVERVRVATKDSDPDIAASLERELDQVASLVREAQDALKASEELADRGRQRIESAIAWMRRTIAATEIDVEAAVDVLRDVANSRTEALCQVVSRRQSLDELVRTERQLNAKLEQARSGVPEWRGRVLLRVLVRERATAMRVRYTIPCALWRPIHRATLHNRGAMARVSWEVGAMAWNASGEDWRNVELVCSTARPGGHATAPILTDDFVVARRRAKEVVVAARDENIKTAREGDTVPTREIPGVEDGGEPRTYTAPYPVHLPSNGRPVHVRLEEWEADAEVAWMAHPERSAEFVLKTRQTNAGSRPLLAGPVELLRQSETRSSGGAIGAVGRGRIGFVPPGEPFALGWGSHDALRVTRKAEQKLERTRITGYQTWTFNIDLKVANLGEETLAVEVRERVPVSEIADVKVALPTATPAMDGGPNLDGLCTWRLVLEPGTIRDVHLAYTVEAPSTVRLPWG